MEIENSNALSVSDQGTHALAPYAAMSADLSLVQAVIEENLGSGGMSEFDLQKIKVPSGGGIAYEVQQPTGPSVAQTFEAIIVMARDTRGYWPLPLEETGGIPPQCHSNDCKVGMGDPSGVCAVCPFAQFGSDKGKDGQPGKGQACKQTKQLFVMRAGSGSGLPEIFSVPPTGLKAYRQFSMQLAGRLAPIYSVITEIGLSKVQKAGSAPYAVPTFRAVRGLEPAEIEKVKAYAKVFRPIFDAPITLTPAAAQPAPGSTEGAW